QGLYAPDVGRHAYAGLNVCFDENRHQWAGGIVGLEYDLVPERSRWSIRLERHRYLIAHLARTSVQLFERDVQRSVGLNNLSDSPIEHPCVFDVNGVRGGGLTAGHYVKAELT